MNDITLEWFINPFVFTGEEMPSLVLAGAGQVRRQRRAAEVQVVYGSCRQAPGGTEMLVEAGMGLQSTGDKSTPCDPLSHGSGQGRTAHGP